MVSRKFLYFFIFSILFCSEDSLSLEPTYNTNQLNSFPFFGHVPSLGQLENDQPIKALSLMAMKAYWTIEYNTSKKENNISDRNRSMWWLIFLLIYGPLDAYVESNLKQFPDDPILDSLSSTNNEENK